MSFMNLFKKKRDNNNIVDEWINEGKKLIYPQKYDSWENYVKKSANSKYFGLEVSGVLFILNTLEKEQSMENVIKIISKDSVACDYMRSDLKNRVFEFSNRGPEFLEYILKDDDINDLLRKKIEEMKEINNNYRNNL